MQSAEVTMSTRATAAIAGATSATNTAARAKSAMDAVIARQQTALDGVRAAETVQIGRAAGLPGCASPCCVRGAFWPRRPTDNSRGLLEAGTTRS